MSKKFLDKFDETIEKISKVFDRIAGWAVFAAMLVVVINVILRKLSGLSPGFMSFFEKIGISKLLIASYDYVSLLSALIVAFGISYCLVNNAHISIDFIADKMDKKTHGVVTVITSILAFLMMAVFTYKLFEFGTQKLTTNSVTTNAQIPIFIFVYIIALCFALLCFVMLTKIRKNIKDVKKS